MPIKQALGRGLSALIPSTKVNREGLNEVPSKVLITNAEGPVEIPMEKIRPNISQPRVDFDQNRMQELVDSVRQKGLLQPILVRALGDGYEIIAGERRFRAAKALRWAKIPAIVRNTPSEESLELALIENIQREDLNALEEARAYERLLKEFHFTQEAIASAVGKDRSSIANAVRLLSLPGKIQERLLHNELSAGHAKVLLGITDKGRQEWLCEKIIKEGLSVRQAEDLARQGQPAKGHEDAHLRLLTDELQRTLGTRVRIHPRGKGGRLVIEYYSSEDLDRILVALSIKKF
jgi:ParB family chromosome partitioning protein